MLQMGNQQPSGHVGATYHGRYRANVTGIIA